MTDTLKVALEELDKAVSEAVAHRDDSPALDVLLAEQARIHLEHPEAFR